MHNTPMTFACPDCDGCTKKKRNYIITAAIGYGGREYNWIVRDTKDIRYDKITFPSYDKAREFIERVSKYSNVYDCYGDAVGKSCEYCLNQGFLPYPVDDNFHEQLMDLFLRTRSIQSDLGDWREKSMDSIATIISQLIVDDQVSRAEAYWDGRI